MMNLQVSDPYEEGIKDVLEHCEQNLVFGRALE